MRRDFDILNYCSEEYINKKVTFLGENPLTTTSHNFNQYGAIKIIDAAKKSFENYFNQAKELPSIALIEVVLAANRNYNKVVLPNIIRLKTDHSYLITFNDLDNLLLTKEKDEFFKIWGHRDDKKLQILLDIINEIKSRKKNYPNYSDYEIMNHWANNVDIYSYNDDPIGRIKNIALATLQHLRMTFGANTVKPDQRVMEVLDYEFNLKGLNKVKSVLVVEQISKITKIPALMLDQIFVLYGSGYYNRNGSNSLPNFQNIVIKDIARKLKNLNVDFNIISQSTNLSLQEISEL